MNDSTIQMIAQAIIANTKVIQSLIDALPHDTKQAVAEVVAPVPAPVVQAASPIQAVPTVAAPVPTTVPAVAVPSVPVASGTPVVMPAPPLFVAPVPVAAVAGAPFTDGKGLIDYVMAAYRTMGPQKGAQIQTVLTGLGYANINDIKQSDYAALFAGIEALKVS